MKDMIEDKGWDNEVEEWKYFINFVRDNPTLKPYRTEWMIYDEDVKLAGSIDMVYENEDGTLSIYDWKRCKEIAYENYGKCMKTPCIQHLPDTNFWHYSLQLNMYKTILETKYNKKVVGLFLLCLHPDNAYKTYDRIEVPFLEKEMRDLIELREFEVQNNINT
jgi:ATP-dependent exoDNAse (exonuclease V) beta subunit